VEIDRTTRLKPVVSRVIALKEGYVEVDETTRLKPVVSGVIALKEG